MSGDKNTDNKLLLRGLPDRTRRSHVQVNNHHTAEQIDECVGGPYGIVRFCVPKRMLIFTKNSAEKQQRTEVMDMIGDTLGKGFAISIDRNGKQATRPNGVIAYRITVLSPAGAIVLKRGYHNFPDREDPGPRAILVEKGTKADDPQYTRVPPQALEIRFENLSIGTTSRSLQKEIFNGLGEFANDFSKTEGVRVNPANGKRDEEGTVCLNQYFQAYLEDCKTCSSPCVVVDMRV